MIVDSHRLGAGEEAAEIAAMLTERGLGGDGADLDYRLDQFRRDRSPRASSARRLARRWAQQVATTGGPPAEELSHSTGVMLAFAFPGPGRAQPGQWQLHARQRRGARGRTNLPAGARALYRRRRADRHAGQGRILLAAPIAQQRSKRALPTRSRHTEEITFDRDGMALRARRRRTLHAITLSEAPIAAVAFGRRPPAFSPTDWLPPGSTGCRGRRP